MISYLLAILASYRLARMLAMEEGPLEIFARVRNRFDPEQATWLGRGLNCPLCLGFWCSLVMALLLAHQDATMHRSETLLAWLAIAGGQTLLHLWAEK